MQAAFVLPQTFPVRRETLNYSGVAVGIVLMGIVIFWFLPGGLGARRWYRGERKTAKIGIDSVRQLYPSLASLIAHTPDFVLRFSACLPVLFGLPCLCICANYAKTACSKRWHVPKRKGVHSSAFYMPFVRLRETQEPTRHRNVSEMTAEASWKIESVMNVSRQILNTLSGTAD